MSLVGFKPTISASERPKTYALDRAATGNGNVICFFAINKYKDTEPESTTLHEYNSRVYNSYIP